MAEEHIDQNLQASTEDEFQAPSTENESQAQAETTETEEQHEGKPINQEAVNKKINKLTFEKHEERRLREEAENKAAEVQRKLDELTQKKQEIVIPPMPDAYDPEYDAKLAERDKAIQDKATADADAAAAKKVADDKAAEQVRLQQEETNKRVDAMFDSAEKIGISKEEMDKADKTVSMFIRDPSLAQFILAQKDSALVVNYLAGNVAELEQISRMNPVEASAYIVTKVLPVAQQFKPELPNTPDPLDIPKGRAAGNKDPYMQGVTME